MVSSEGREGGNGDLGEGSIEAGSAMVNRHRSNNGRKKIDPRRRTAWLNSATRPQLWRNGSDPALGAGLKSKSDRLCSPQRLLLNRAKVWCSRLRRVCPSGEGGARTTGHWIGRERRVHKQGDGVGYGGGIDVHPNPFLCLAVI